MADDAFREFEVIPLKRHAGIGDVEGQKAVGVCRVERQLSARVQCAQKPHQFPRSSRQQARFELGEAGQEDVHGLTEALQAFAGLLSQPVRRAAAEERQEAFRGRTVNDGERQCLVAEPAGLEFCAPAPVHLACEAVLTDRVEIRFDGLGDLVDVIAEFRPELRDDAGKKRRHLVEIGIVGRVAVDPLEPNAAEEFVHPGPHGLVVDEAYIGQHMREAGLARIPVWRHCAGIERSITGHSCPRHGWSGCAWAVSPAGPSSSRR